MTAQEYESAGRAYDVAIIGGGLVGASLACALAPLGMRAALIESVPFRAASQPSYDDRTLALSLSSCRILESLGVWPSLARRATPIREIHVRELDRPGRVVMDPSELGLDRFGNVVEAREFGAVMAAALPELCGLDLLCPASVSAIEPAAGAVGLRYDEGGEDRVLRAKLLIGADGAHSFVRKAYAIDADAHDYDQTAVICNVMPERPHEGRAFECFTPTGPFAMMPHVEGRCGLIWCVSSADAEGLLALPERDFLKRANRRFGEHLGDLHKMGLRSSYPLRLVRARKDIDQRAVLLGNAAHAIHPIGAQGFNLGLRDVAVLAEVLADGQAETARAGREFDPGDAALLRRYSEWRAPDQKETVAWSDGLARLYAKPGDFAAAARTAGLLAHAFIPPLRRRLAVRAMGFRGRTPRLALGEPL